MTVIAEKSSGSTSRKEEEEEITTSCGNVYEDLRLPHSDERMAKSVMALAITDTLESRQLTQEAAAERLDTDCTTIADLQQGRLTHITFDSLIRFANALGLGVQITILVANDERGKTSAHK